MKTTVKSAFLAMVIVAAGALPALADTREQSPGVDPSDPFGCGSLICPDIGPYEILPH